MSGTTTVNINHPNFTPVQPTDFWDPKSVTAPILGDPWHNDFWGNWNTPLIEHPGFKNYGGTKSQEYADALTQQIALHRTLAEIIADQETCTAGWREQAGIVTDSQNELNQIFKQYPDWLTGVGTAPDGTFYDDIRARVEELAKIKDEAGKIQHREYGTWAAFLKAEYDAEVKREKKAGTYTPPEAGSTGPSVKVATLPLLVNLPSVREAYFSPNNPDIYEHVYGNDPAKVRYAMDLWNQPGGHKGMIKTYGELETQQKFTNTNKKNYAVGLQNYGFQFLYNPSSINMSYSGIPNVDITMYTSGQSMTNLWAPNSFQSQITFDILLNRMNDMKYLDKKAGKIADVYANENLYPGRQFTGSKLDMNHFEHDIAMIAEKGTMYDMEYLLRSTLGFTQDTKWRGVTADLGWTAAMPVELHLGKNLRYLVVISGINVNHVIFDGRMVPLMSVVRLTCQRIPDYPDKSTVAK